MLYLIVAFLASFLLCVFLIKLGFFHDTGEGPQKFHEKPTPRTGGVAVYLSLLLVSLSFYGAGKSFAKEFLLFLISAFPVFVGGILEDTTRRVAPKWRLLGGVFSGALAFLLLSASVTRVDLPLFDDLLKLSAVSFVFTSFAVAGVSHAFNIIDGFNGLASGVAILVFGAYAYVSFLKGDYFLLYLSLTALSATLGFFLWNYPNGHIFLGDGGAYFLGFTAAVTGVLLVSRYPDVSPWFPFLLVLYPVWETLFSVYRRRFLKNYSPHLPDALHFHQLVYRRVVKLFLGRVVNPTERNYYTSPFLWILELVCFIPAVLFWNSTSVLVLCSLGFVVFYTWLYFRIVRFRTPRFFVKKVFRAS